MEPGSELDPILKVVTSSGRLNEIDERLKVLEARAKRIDDMERAGRIVYRIMLWVGGLSIGLSTMWSQWVDHWGWWHR